MVTTTETQPQRLRLHRTFQASTLECLPFPSPGGLPDPGNERRSPALQADSTPELPGKPISKEIENLNNNKHNYI